MHGRGTHKRVYLFVSYILEDTVLVNLFWVLRIYC